MIRSITTCALGLLLLTGGQLEAQQLTRGKRYSEISLRRPMLIDSVNVQNRPFDLLGQIKQPYALKEHNAQPIAASTKGVFSVPKAAKGEAATLSIYSFNLVSPGYTRGSIKLHGRGRYALYLGERLLGSNEQRPSSSDSLPALSLPLSLEATHGTLQVRVLGMPSDSVSGDFRLAYEPEAKFAPLDSAASAAGTHYIDWNYITHGKQLYSAAVSPSGRYVLVTYSDRAPKKGATYQELRDASGKIIRTTQHLSGAQWMPKQDMLVLQRYNGLSQQLLKINPATGESSVWVDQLPGTSYAIGPDEQTLYIYQQDKGPEKHPMAIRRLSPNDRMPGWRHRTSIYRYDIRTGAYTPLLYGLHSASIQGITEDGKQLLISEHKTKWTETPYNQTTLYRYTPETGRIDTILRDQFNIAGASFIPGTDDLLIEGSPDAFGGIANTIGRPANGYERELFRLHIPTGKVTALTRDFDPNVESVHYVGKLHAFVFTAENGSRKSLYKLDVRSNKISQIPTSEEVVRALGVARYGSDLWYIGQSLNNASRLYRIAGASKEQLIWDLSAEKLRDVRFTAAKDFFYTTPDGVKIDGWYYLPPNFDPKKKYPMIVYYYGGTVPLTRQLETTYNLAMFAAQGYIAYSLNPRGCTGYGQAFAADHLNAWGTKTADDIIGAVKAFAAEHPYVDIKKIGCCGASYGGFMTQYLQTKTDLFAAAISHAGISSISSYWAGGYWGIGYSSVASASSYPWNNPELYTKHSPLFNADKIHTPLLLLHGTSDVNVPPSESTALYNALKILGRPVELIEFTGEDHHILEPERQDIWIRTICAWFAKYLQDKPEWWDMLYPHTPYDK